jgi:6-phosphogluconolactonase
MEDLALAAALHFVYQGKSAIAEKNLFTVALGSDSISAAVYSRLSDDSALNKQLPWDSVHFFYTGARHMERGKAPSRDQAACAAIETIMEPLPVNVHRIKARYPSARGAAADYERQLRKFFALQPGQWPRFDLALLGLGADGRTASLYLNSKALRERERFVVAQRVGPKKAYAITLTVPVLNNAACVMILAAGDNKARLLRDVFTRRYQPVQYPAQLIRPKRGKLLWLIDERAGRLLRDMQNE